MFLAEVDKHVAAAEKIVFLATDDELTEWSFAQRYGSKVPNCLSAASVDGLDLF